MLHIICVIPNNLFKVKIRLWRFNCGARESINLLTWLDLCIENFITLCPIISPYLKPRTGLWWNWSDRIWMTVSSSFFYSLFVKCPHAFHRLKVIGMVNTVWPWVKDMSHTWAIFWSFSLSWLTAENNVCEMPIVFRHAVFDFVRIDKFFTFRPFLTVIFSLSTNLVAGFRWHMRRSNTSVLSFKGFLIVLELISGKEWDLL